MVAYSFKKRFVLPIRVGLGLIGMGEDQPPMVPKWQTIRAHRIGRARNARPGETLQLYCEMRTKHCFKIADALCTRVRPIEIEVYSNTFGLFQIEGRSMSGTEIENFARSDGFEDLEKMHRFWISNHGAKKFSGVLIEWEPLP